MNLRPQIRGPISIEGFKINDGSGADVTDGQPNAIAFGLSNVSPRGVALTPHFFRRGQTVVAQATKACDVDNIGATSGGGIRLRADRAEVIEGMTGNAELKFGRFSSVGVYNCKQNSR